MAGGFDMMFRPMTVLQKVFVLFAFLAAGALAFRLSVPAFAAEKQIRIGVAVNQTSGTLSSSGTMNFKAADETAEGNRPDVRRIFFRARTGHVNDPSGALCHRENSFSLRPVLQLL